MSESYSNRPKRILFNTHDQLRERRGLDRIIHYSSPSFEKIRKSLNTPDNLDFHVWKVGSRFYKLAAEYYGDSRLWWVIAFFNKKPTDGHVDIGDVVYIPMHWQPIYDAIVDHEVQYPERM